MVLGRSILAQHRGCVVCARKLVLHRANWRAAARKGLNTSSRAQVSVVAAAGYMLDMTAGAGAWQTGKVLKHETELAVAECREAERAELLACCAYVPWVGCSDGLRVSEKCPEYPERSDFGVHREFGEICESWLRARRGST